MAELPLPAGQRQDQKKMDHKKQAARAKRTAKARKEEGARQIEEGQEPTSGEINVDTAAEAPEVPEEASVEISADLMESLSDDAQETYDELNQESKGLVGKLFEKVKSTEIVQNLVDRVAVWNNDRIAAKVDLKIGGLKGTVDKERNKIQDFQNEQDHFQKNVQEIEDMLRSVGEDGEGLSPDTLTLIDQKKDAIGGMIGSSENNKAEAQNNMDVQIDKLAEFQGGAREARERLDGRIAEKQEANNQAIESYSTTARELVDQFDDNQAEIDAQQSLVDGLDKKLKGDLPKELKAEAKRKIDKAKGQVKMLEGFNKKINKEAGKVKKEIDKLEDQNAKFQTKRDKIFPPSEQEDFAKEPSAETDIADKTPDAPTEAASQRVVIEDGEFTYSIVGDKVKRINEDGSYTSLGVDQLPQSVKDQLPSKEESPQSEATEITDDDIIEESAAEEQEEEKGMTPQELAQSFNFNLTQAEKDSGMEIDPSSISATAKLDSVSAAQKFLRNEVVKGVGVRAYKDVDKKAKGKIDRYLKQIKSEF